VLRKKWNLQRKSNYIKLIHRRLQDEKEKETQKLREKQEKAKDQQSVMDAIRAKRAFEESDRNAREKEKQEILLRVITIDKLIYNLLK